VTAGSGPGSCPRCGARVEPGQEYCLECGLRLPGGGLTGTVGSAWQRRFGRREWLLPILAALVVAAAMTGIAIAVSSNDEAEGGFIDATTTQSIPVPTTESVPTEPTTTAATETEPATTETEPTPPPRPQLVEWPLSQNGYTVVLASLPASGGRAIAIRKAREALRSGLPDVGVLDSGEFSSLHPGYYVVFSGIYANQRAALQATARVQRLYPAAYIRQISR
jgi:eukaryotic-like serine/threonine-protein kinase